MKRTIAALAGLALAIQVAPALAFDWNGFYAGVNAGYSTGHSDAEYDEPQFSTADIDMNPSGWMLGVQAGGNAVMDGIVLGIEGDVYISNITDTIYDQAADDHGSPGEEITSTTDFGGTLRARVGFDGGDFMPYLTAGLGAANVTVDASDGPLSDSALLWGWVAGAGVEFAVGEQMTIKGEYLYADLGEHTWFAGDIWSSTSHSTSHTVRLGLNFALD